MATKNKYIPLIIGVAIAAGVVIGGKLNFTDTIVDAMFLSPLHLSFEYPKAASINAY